MLTNTKPGRLNIVGIGINTASQLTPIARSIIAGADIVYYLCNSALAISALSSISDRLESLGDTYEPTRSRTDSYNMMIDRIMRSVRQDRDVCVALYGHPTIYVYPSIRAIKKARSEGFFASILPGISAEDCMFADLCIDPGEHGLQSFDANDFLLYRRRFDTSSGLLLWQIAAIGELGKPYERNGHGIQVLREVLAETYPDTHCMTLYEAATSFFEQPRIEALRLDALPSASLNKTTSLYIPPCRSPIIDTDILRRLGFELKSRPSS